MSFSKCAAVLLAVLSMVGGSSFLPTSPVSAQAPPSAGFNVSPPLWDFSGSRGDTISKTFTISNAGETDFEVATEVRNFLSDPVDGATARFTDDPTGYDLRSYLTLTPATLTLKPSSTAEMTVTVRIPQDASPGGHFGAITFHQGALPAGGNVKVDQAITSILLLKVAGQIDTKLDLTGLKGGAGRKLFGMYAGDADIPIESTFVNSGNVHVQPDLSFTIDNKLFGGDSAVRSATPGYTLPGATRTYRSEWKTPNLPGIYEVSLSAGFDGRALEKSTTIVVLPPIWGIGLLIFAVFVLTIFMVRRAVRHRASHAKKKKRKRKIVIEVDDDEDEDESPAGGHFR